MKVYQANEIKNIALIGGTKVGKTTLAECMLFEGGIINRRGSIDDKNTVSDYREIELERGNSISSTVLYTEFSGKKINIIDTPGFDDFAGEVIAALNVVEAAVLVVNAQNGVEVGTEITWRHTNQHNNPVIFVINQLEHEKSNFDNVISQLKQNFGEKVTVAQYPVNEGINFNSVIDLIQMKLLKFPAGGGKAEVLDIPDNEKAKAKELQSALIEAAAAGDDSLMEIFFEKETLTEEEMQRGIRLGLIKRDIYPVFCTSAKHNMGVARLLEFIGNTVPSASEMPAKKTTEGKELTCNPSEPVSLLIFKLSTEAHLGEISFFKIYNGEISEGDDVINTRTSSKERVAQLFVTAGKNREKVQKLVAGDIGTTIKLKNTRVNDTLNSLKNPDIIIEPIHFPEPRFRTAIKAKNTNDDEKLGTVLNEMHKIDPTLIAGYSKELKQLIVEGQGELHLNIARWHIEKLEKISIDFIKPKIPYRETITKVSQAAYQHKKQSGGSGQFGEVYMVIEPYVEGMPDPAKYKVKQTMRKSSVTPLNVQKGDTEISVSARKKEEIELPWGGKLIFYNCIVGGSIDARFLPAILKGLMEKMEEGPLTGSYARDIRVAVYDGKMHPVDSNEISFKLAGRTAFSMAFKEAGPKILEPIYEVEVSVPDEKMGDVMTDLQGRRAIVLGMDSEGNYKKIKARAPLAEMDKYSTTLSSLTSGRAMFSMKFIEYGQVPSDIQDKLLKEYETQTKEEE